MTEARRVFTFTASWPNGAPRAGRGRLVTRRGVERWRRVLEKNCRDVVIRDEWGREVEREPDHVPLPAPPT